MNELPMEVAAAMDDLRAAIEDERKLHSEQLLVAQLEAQDWKLKYYQMVRGDNDLAYRNRNQRDMIAWIQDMRPQVEELLKRMNGHDVPKNYGDFSE